MFPAMEGSTCFHFLQETGLTLVTLLNTEVTLKW